MKVTKDRIRHWIEKIQQQKVLVLGDLMLDQFIWGKVNRISPEAPVPVVHVTHESAYPGGAANVARNLSDFGLSVHVGGLLGNDANGESLLKLLEAAGISTQAILPLTGFPTIIKTRIIARHQQVVRVDREEKHSLTESDLELLRPRLLEVLPQMNAVILEDYGKGFITQELVNEVVALARSNGAIIAVDPNPGNLLDWSGVTAVKPNRQEAYAAAGMPFAEDETSLSEADNRLLEKWQVPYLLVTLGEEGMILFHPPEKPYHTKFAGSPYRPASQPWPVKNGKELTFVMQWYFGDSLDILPWRLPGDLR